MTTAETKAALEQLKVKLVAQHLDKLPKPSYPAVIAAAKDFAHRLSQQKIPYYFCGGFACVYLCEAQRTTADIDIVVKDGPSYVQLRDVVLGMPNVIEDNVLSHSPLYYHKATNEFVEMDCLLAGLGAGFPKWDEKDFGTVTKDQITFLSPGELLKIKFRSWNDTYRKSQPEKHSGDQTDILGLRKYIRYTLKTKVSKQYWDDDAKKALDAWIKQYKDADDWKAIGL